MKINSIEIIKTLHSKGYQALWAGGCVRDMLLSKSMFPMVITTHMMIPGLILTESQLLREQGTILKQQEIF